MDQGVLEKLTNFYNKVNCVKGVRIRSFFWSVFFRVLTEYGDFLFSPNMEKYELDHALVRSTKFRKKPAEFTQTLQGSPKTLTFKNTKSMF